MENRKPNCIYIVADQLRYDVLGKGITPNIDRLIGESVEFTNAYCASPLCVPARGAMFTGTYPGTNGSLINGWYPPERKYSRVKAEMDHLYKIMERLEMDCIHSGKQHLFIEGQQPEDCETSATRWLTTERTYKEYLKEHGKVAPGGPLFRTPVPEMSGGKVTRVSNYSNPHTGRYEEGKDYYFDEYFTTEALKTLKEYTGEKPLFLSMMYLAPHPPLQIPEPWYSLVKTDGFVLPENVGVWYPGQSPLQKYNLTGVVGNSYHLDDWKETWRVYLGLVGMLDDCVGRILKELKKQNLYDDSLIIFTSDHGEMLGSHCLFQKMCMYEESAKVPLSIHLPGGVSGGTQIADYVSHIDLLPTICQLYETETTHKMDGRSLLNRMTSQTPLPEKPVYIQYDGNASLGNFQRCVVWKGHKLIVDIFKDEIYYELYYIEKDPQETDNLALYEEKRELMEEMKQLLITHLDTIKDSNCKRGNIKSIVTVY